MYDCSTTCISLDKNKLYTMTMKIPEKCHQMDEWLGFCFAKLFLFKYALRYRKSTSSSYSNKARSETVKQAIRSLVSGHAVFPSKKYITDIKAFVELNADGRSLVFQQELSLVSIHTPQPAKLTTGEGYGPHPSLGSHRSAELRCYNKKKCATIIWYHILREN